MRNFIYGLLVAGATLFTGCQAVDIKPCVPEQRQDQVTIAHLTSTENLTSTETLEEKVLEHSVIEISASYDIPEVTELSQERTAYLHESITLSLNDYYHDIPYYSIAHSLLGEDPNERSLFSFDKYNHKMDRSVIDHYRNPYDRYDQERQYTTEFGARELRITLMAAREMIHRLGEEYRPFRKIDQFIRYIEKIGKKLRAIEDGIQEIWTIDLSNPGEDFLNPLRPLKEALGLEKPQEREEQYDRRRGYPVISGSIEPTLGGHPWGTRAGQDLTSVLRGEKEADLGISLQLKIDF